jgi:hypothetical protein
LDLRDKREIAPVLRRRYKSVMTISLVLADTVTAIPPHASGFVLVTGSHGGRIAAYLAAKSGARAAIFNDAGRGLDDAGVAGLADLDAIGVAAACVAHTSARIADAHDTYSNGKISTANAAARSCGVETGMSAHDATALLQKNANRPNAAPRAMHEGRMQLTPQVLGIDSIGLVAPGDAHKVLVIGSHGALHGGREESALAVDALFAVFHDAGVGKENVGVSRLPVLAARGIAAACVDFHSARIGEARALWETGVLSHCNAVAQSLGIRAGLSVQTSATQIIRMRT